MTQWSIGDVGFDALETPFETKAWKPRRDITLRVTCTLWLGRSTS